jgi:parvulin-like peptidyl-prolyl isomerase
VRHSLLHPSTRQLNKLQRERLQRRLIWGTAAALVLIVVAVLGYGYWRENVARGGEVAASVAGTSITLDDLVPWAKPQAQMLQQAMANAQGGDDQTTQLQFQLQRIPDQVLQQRVDALLHEREAQARGIAVSDSEVDADVRRRMAQQAAREAPRPAATPSMSPTAASNPATVGAAAAAEGTPAAAATAVAAAAETPTAAPTPTAVPTLTQDGFRVQYDDFLNRTGYSDQQFRQLIREALLVQKIKDDIGAKVPAAQEQVHVRQIEVADKAKAQDVLDKLNQGQPFDDLAKSEAANTDAAAKSGDIGWVPRGIMGDQWDSAVFALQPGQRSGIVDNGTGGYSIVEVLERDPSHPLNAEQLDRLRSDAYESWLTKARADAGVSSIALTDEQRTYILRRAGVARPG